jgi:L-alanine-DL-glutamate epimerase-like enolase superfamily enzyme
MPVLVDTRLALIEQPFAMGEEAELEGLHSPIRLAADESVQGIADLPGLVGRFNVVNIKLDKLGGLTEGFAMARRYAAWPWRNGWQYGRHIARHGAGNSPWSNLRYR